MYVGGNPLLCFSEDAFWSIRKTTNINKQKESVRLAHLALYKSLSESSKTLFPTACWLNHLINRLFQLSMPLTDSWTSPQSYFLFSSPILWNSNFMCPVSQISSLIIILEDFFDNLFFVLIMHFFSGTQQRKTLSFMAEKKSKYWRGEASLSKKLNSVMILKMFDKA